MFLQGFIYIFYSESKLSKVRLKANGSPVSLPSAPGTCVSSPLGAEALGQQLCVEAMVQVAVNLLGPLRADPGSGGDGLRGAARDNGTLPVGDKGRCDKSNGTARSRCRHLRPGFGGLRARQTASPGELHRSGSRERKCRAGGGRGEAEDPKSLICDTVSLPRSLSLKRLRNAQRTGPMRSHIKDLAAQREGSGDTERKGSQAAKHAPLPVGHGLQRVEVMAHVEGSGVAEPRDAQVEVEQVPFVALRLRGHTDGRVLPLLHQSQVCQQSRGFLLAGAEEDPHPGLDQG